MFRMKLFFILMITLSATMMTDTICWAAENPTEPVTFQVKIGSDADIENPGEYIPPPNRNSYTSRNEKGKIINPFKILSPEPIINPLLPSGRDTEWVIIEAFDEKGAAANVGNTIQEVRITSLNSDRSYSANVGTAYPVMQVYIKPVVEALKAAVGSILKVDLIDKKSNVCYTRYFMYWADWDLYDTWGQTLLGLHTPCGLMGLYQSEDGVVAAALPLSVAVGVKYYFNETFYLGGSVIGSIAYYGLPASAEGANFILNSWTYGICFDINDYFYIGYEWKDNLVSGQRENIMIFGVGKVLGEWLTR